MRNTIILTSILFLAVIAATIYYFKNLDNELNSSKPLGFLPQNTLFVASITNNQETEELFKEFEIFNALTGEENITTWKLLKNKLLNRDIIKSNTSESQIYISFHPENKSVSTLFTIPLKQTIPNADLTGILNDISLDFKTKTIDTLGSKIYQIQYGQKDSILHTTYYHDILFASPSLNLIIQILNKHSKHLSSEQIEFFTKNTLGTSPLSVYFPHQQYDSLINLTQRNSKGPFINLFTKLHGQSVLNINFKEDALILAGESQLDQYPENYASLFKNQEKTQQYLYEYFPSNTAIYAEFAISNSITFQKDLHSLFKRRKEKFIEQMDTSKASDVFNQAVGNNFALVELNNQNYLGFVALKDSLKLKELKGTILEKNNDAIGRFQQSDILYKQYGDVFKEFKKPYYTIIDSMMIVANSSSTLREYRKDFEQNDLLIGTLGFINLEKNQSKEANINIFVHSKNAQSKIINSLKEPFRKNFNNKENFGYQDFFSWSIQLSGTNGNMYSQIYAIYKSKNNLGTTPEWTFELGEKAITKPYVFEESDTSQFILIQKLDHTLYALNPKGNETWRKVISGRIIGDLKQASDRTILFVTDNNLLYRVDQKGNNLNGFPIKLDAKPIDLFLSNSKNILLTSDKRILSFELNSTPTSNWSFPEIEGEISTNIINHDDNYIFGTSVGIIYCVNQNGNKIYQTKIDENKIVNLTKTHDNKIIVLNQQGGITLLNKSSKEKQFTIEGDFKDFYSSFAQISKSQYSNLTIINNNQLHVFEITDPLKNLFQFNFTKEITDEPQFFIASNDNKVHNIGIASRATNLLYVFDNSGQLINDFPIEGLPLFYFGKIDNNSDNYLLCMRRDHKLYAFRQKK